MVVMVEKVVAVLERALKESISHCIVWMRCCCHEMGGHCFDGSLARRAGGGHLEVEPRQVNWKKCVKFDPT